jgi:hypothetical protein
LDLLGLVTSIALHFLTLISIGLRLLLTAKLKAQLRRKRPGLILLHDNRGLQSLVEGFSIIYLTVPILLLPPVLAIEKKHLGGREFLLDFEVKETREWT